MDSIIGKGISGILDDITSSYEAAKSNIENVVVPFWQSEATSAANAISNKVADLTGWLTDANNNIAAGKAILDQLQAAGQATTKDQTMYSNINAEQVNLTQELQNNVQAQLSSQTLQQAVPATSSTAMETGQLLPLSGLGLIPLIIAAGAVLTVSAGISYEIYKTYSDSKDYLTYMQARQQAIQNGTPLPPLPASLAKYQASSWIAWLLSGIVLAGIGGTIVYVKYFRHKHKVYANPYSSHAKYKHKELVPMSEFDPNSIRTIRRGKYLFRIGCPKGHWSHGRCSVGTRVVSELIPNPYKIEKSQELQKGVKVFTDFHGFEPTTLKDIKVPDNYPDYLVLIGKGQHVTYESNKINGSPRADKKKKWYQHDFENDTVWATDIEGKGLYAINPHLKVKPEGIIG